MGTCMQFGYTRKDIILLGVGIIAFGYALYYGLQAFFGVDALVAGNYVQLFVFLGIGVGYISTYIFRVANKVGPPGAAFWSRLAFSVCLVCCTFLQLLVAQMKVVLGHCWMEGEVRSP